MAASRRFPPSRPMRAALSSAGRGVANRRAAHRRRRQPAGAGPVRGRRRQDAGARRDDGEQGPDLRDRPRRASPPPIWDRMERAGVRNVQVRAPKGPQDILGDLEGACDLVLVDAPCTGAGTWRRNPDAKWRVRPGAIEQRIVEQDAVLRDAARYVKRGGRIAYITCSVLRVENEARVEAFWPPTRTSCRRHGARGAQGGRAATCRARLDAGPGLRLSPATAGRTGSTSPFWPRLIIPAHFG